MSEKTEQNYLIEKMNEIRHLAESIEFLYTADYYDPNGLPSTIPESTLAARAVKATFQIRQKVEHMERKIRNE